MLSGSTRLRSLWTPKGIAPALWVDASDYSTFLFASGTSRITEWRDKSGNNRHLSQSTSSQRPIYVPNGLNGFPSVYFDGNDFLKNAGTYAGGAATFFIVFYKTSSSDSSLVLVNRNSLIFEIGTWFSSNYRNITFEANGSPQKLAFGFNTQIFKQNLILCVQYDGAGDSSTDYLANLNGGNSTVLQSGPLGFFSETGFSVGGRPIQSYFYYTGYVSEILYFESQLDINTVNKIAGALAHKWRLTGVLPANHPFKNYPPRGV